ncbi:hypothetical protein [Kribbella sp.]|uniref:hypothetical protein n=1 Tax=Kribbella sp. TaxID=1871183 RepID=UPI002D74A7A0|nr:hypothetical protein [Kribbella sp.]HZX06723.1 hypothetical protein [Kribbella sp.]
MDTSTGSDTAAAQAFVADRLNADFAGTGLAEVHFQVDAAWTGTPGDDLILVAGGHEFPLAVEGRGVERACAFAAYQLQSDAMSDLNRPWPEVATSQGKTVGVLLAPAEVRGIAVWELAGEPFCAVGHLHKAVEAAGLHIK